MIKEWCAKCKGSGLSITPMSQCGKCNGMGYTELEPELKTHVLVNGNGGMYFHPKYHHKKIEVYIKENLK